MYRLCTFNDIQPKPNKTTIPMSAMKSNQTGFKPLSPHDALKHHFTSMKTDLIFIQQRVLERKFP